MNISYSEKDFYYILTIQLLIKYYFGTYCNTPQW